MLFGNRDVVAVCEIYAVPIIRHIVSAENAASYEDMEPTRELISINAISRSG
jgi:hypothetical protein